MGRSSMVAKKIRVCIGGTFDPLHDGHKELLKKVFGVAKGGEVVIGLTSDKMARKRSRLVLSFAVRSENLRQYIGRNFGKKAKIAELNDAYGLTLSEDFDFIVVSPETFPMVTKINDIRKKKGMALIRVIKVDYKLAKDGKPISSTRIKKGEIDRYGNPL